MGVSSSKLFDEGHVRQSAGSAGVEARHERRSHHPLRALGRFTRSVSLTVALILDAITGRFDP
jgi:hypothetical protein